MYSLSATGQDVMGYYVLNGEEENILDSVVLEVCNSHSKQTTAAGASGERKSTNRVSKWLHEGKKGDNAKQIRKIQVDIIKHFKCEQSISGIDLLLP